MENEKRKKAIEKIRSFVDSGEDVNGKVRFDTMEAVSATYSIALLILDLHERLDKEELDYNKRTKKFAEIGK